MPRSRRPALFAAIKNRSAKIRLNSTIGLPARTNGAEVLSQIVELRSPWTLGYRWLTVVTVAIAGGHHGRVDVGALIRQAREARGLSQDELADRLMGASGSVTLSRNYISRWENGKRGVSAYWLPHLADVLDLPSEQLRDAVMKRRAFLAASSVALFGAGRPNCWLPLPSATTRLCAAISPRLTFPSAWPRWPHVTWG